MVFAHDTEEGLATAAALVITAGRDGEQLPDPAALDEFTRAWEWTGGRTHDQAELQAVRDLRLRLRQLPAWTGAIIHRALSPATRLLGGLRGPGWGNRRSAPAPAAPR